LFFFLTGAQGYRASDGSSSRFDSFFRW
jgi:hypothetical protein